MAHRLRVAYRQEFLNHPKLDGWQSKEQGGDFVVWGPCPECGGETYGPDHPSVGAGAGDRDPADLPAGYEGGEVLANIYTTCKCGAAHGRDDGTGCGRYWIVEVIDPS